MNGPDECVRTKRDGRRTGEEPRRQLRVGSCRWRVLLGCERPKQGSPAHACRQESSSSYLARADYSAS